LQESESSLKHKSEFVSKLESKNVTLTEALKKTEEVYVFIYLFIFFYIWKFNASKCNIYWFELVYIIFLWHFDYKIYAKSILFKMSLIIMSCNKIVFGCIHLFM